MFLVICEHDISRMTQNLYINIIWIYRLEVLDNLEKEIRGLKELGDSTEHHECAEKKRPKVSTVTDTWRNVRGEVNRKNWKTPWKTQEALAPSYVTNRWPPDF